MAESVKEAEPETRPRGQRRGLDRLRASGAGTGNGEGMADQASRTVPTRTTERQVAPAAVPEAAAPVAPDLVDGPSDEVLVDPPATREVAVADEASSSVEGAPPRAETKPPTTTAGRPGRVLVAVIALLVVLVGFLGYRLWNTHSAAQADKRHYDQLNVVDGRNQAALSAARQAAVTLLTYDYRHLDRDFTAVLNGSTGGFKKDFASRQSTAKALFVQGKAIASGQVLDAAVASSTSTTATVLVVIDQSVKNVSVPSGTTKHYRMQLKLNKVGSSWLVSDVEFPA
jgi:Mce-associated membrane protein